jgi:polysaccharide pyruvyl transferase WcaK-like protein
LTAQVGGWQKHTPGKPPRVGFFGLLGSGNIGNDGSLEVVLSYLRAKHPDSIIDFLCAGPETITRTYGLPATPLHWFDSRSGRLTRGATAIAMKTLGKLLDAFRTARWVRRHDIVIVPGMGILEASLPMRPWGWPYALLLMCASGRLFRTKVVMVCVGAGVSSERTSRWMIKQAATLAYYRSYRDAPSKEAMEQLGVDTSDDNVYSDLVFGLPVPPETPEDPRAVGVGIMAYYGGNADRERADEIHAAYVDKIERFVNWLLDNDRRVRLFTGDRVDQHVAAEIISTVRSQRPDMEPQRLVVESAESLTELMQKMWAVRTVVATRYHNVLCSLKLAKPTISIGYNAKNNVLMDALGLPTYCQLAGALDVQRLMAQFTMLEKQHAQARATMLQRNVVAAAAVDRQLADLNTTVFATDASASPAAHSRAR